MKKLSTAVLLIIPLFSFSQVQDASILTPAMWEKQQYCFLTSTALADSTKPAPRMPGRIAGNQIKIGVALYTLSYLSSAVILSDSNPDYSTAILIQGGFFLVGSMFIMSGASKLKYLDPVLDADGVGVAFRL